MALRIPLHSNRSALATAGRCQQAGGGRQQRTRGPPTHHAMRRRSVLAPPTASILRTVQQATVVRRVKALVPDMVKRRVSARHNLPPQSAGTLRPPRQPARPPPQPTHGRPRAGPRGRGHSGMLCPGRAGAGADHRGRHRQGHACTRPLILQLPCSPHPAAPNRRAGDAPPSGWSISCPPVGGWHPQPWARHTPASLQQA